MNNRTIIVTANNIWIKGYGNVGSHAIAEARQWAAALKSSLDNNPSLAFRHDNADGVAESWYSETSLTPAVRAYLEKIDSVLE